MPENSKNPLVRPTRMNKNLFQYSVPKPNVQSQAHRVCSCSFSALHWVIWKKADHSISRVLTILFFPSTSHAGAVVFFSTSHCDAKLCISRVLVSDKKSRSVRCRKICCGKQSSAFATKFADWKTLQNTIL